MWKKVCGMELSLLKLNTIEAIIGNATNRKHNQLFARIRT